MNLRSESEALLGYQAVVTGRQTEPDRIHQKLEPCQPPGLSQIEFRDFVWLDILGRVQDADLFISERLIERAQMEAPDRITLRLSDRIRAQNEKTPTPRANRRACLKLRDHDQTL